MVAVPTGAFSSVYVLKERFIVDFTEVQQCWAWLVLGWLASKKDQGPCSSCSVQLIICYILPIIAEDVNQKKRNFLFTSEILACIHKF